MHMRAKGIDVSHWKQAKSFGAVYDSGVTFVGVKATEGNAYVDSALRAHREALRQQPFLLAIYYHFARSGSPNAQAERLMDAVGELRDNERLCLDLEVSPTPDPAGALEWIDSFFGTLLGAACADRRPLIYTSRRIWRSFGNPQWDLASEIDLWTPRYNTAAEPELPLPWVSAGWTIWQWTDGTNPLHETPGVGKCDANYFRGDETALAEYAGAPVTRPIGLSVA